MRVLFPLVKTGISPTATTVSGVFATKGKIALCAGGYTCGVPEEMLDCDMTVRDVLRLEGVAEYASLAHKDSIVLVPLDDLKTLTASGQKDFAALLGDEVKTMVIK